MKQSYKIFCVISLIFMLFSVACADRTVVDGRGVTVTLPDQVERVITISDGLIESVMFNLGVADKIVGVGSEGLAKTWEYTYQTVSGEEYNYEGGMNPFGYLYPEVASLPLVAQYGSAPNYELIAELDPDVVIIRASSCTFWMDQDSMTKAVNLIESLGIPVVVTYGPNALAGPNNESDMSVVSDEICIIGSVFDKEAEALLLSDYLENQVQMVREYTADISDKEKPDVLVLGLSPQTRKNGGAGDVMGTDTLESYFIEDVVNAKNAFDESGYFKKLNAEQILALNPDAIVLSTDWGYHPASELYEAPYYQNLQELDAVKNRRVLALPWLPCNCDKRLEYPIEMMVIAKAAYPGVFDDVNLYEWLIEFYRNVYGVSRQSAKELISCQWMDWVVEEEV